MENLYIVESHLKFWGDEGFHVFWWVEDRREPAVPYEKGIIGFSRLRRREKGWLEVVQGAVGNVKEPVIEMKDMHKKFGPIDIDNGDKSMSCK